MKAGVLIDWGSDAVYSIDLIKRENHETVCLIFLEPEKIDSEWIRLTSKALEIPLIVGKEEELEDAIKKAKEKYKIRGIACGVIDNLHKKTTMEKVAENLKLKNLNPLWHKNRRTILNDMLKLGYVMRIGWVEGRGFDKYWLGRDVDYDLLHEMKDFRGDFNTIVLNGPVFKNRIKILKSKRVVKENGGRYEIVNAKLTWK